MISVIIPVLNNYVLTDQLLDDISKNTTLPDEIILIDNNSSEPIFDLTKKYTSLKFVYIRNPQNIGVNASWNLGRKISEYKYIVILNNDIRINKKFFEKILYVMDKHTNIGLCSVRVSNNLDNVLNEEKDATVDYSTSIVGNAFILRKESSEKIGDIPKVLFTFCGDNFILSKADQIKCRIAIINNNDIFHYDHKTLFYWKDEQKILKDFYTECAIFKEIKKNYNFRDFEWDYDKEKTMIYDIFPFSNEFDILEIRLNELYNVVDKFIIFECNKTFTGIDKPLYLKENLDKFTKFLDKITLIEIEMPLENNPWQVYNIQIDQVLEKLKPEFKDNDIIMISDVDEIPRKELFTKYTKPEIVRCIQSNFYQVQQRMSYYKYNCLADHDWYGTVILGNKGINQYPAHMFRQWRESSFGIKIFNAGWHFSYIQTAEEIHKKIKSFGHQEFNNEEYNNLKRIETCINEGIYLFDWNRNLDFITFEDLDFPAYLKRNKEKFKNFIWEG